MNPKPDYIAMARKCGADFDDACSDGSRVVVHLLDDELAAFAETVRKDERERAIGKIHELIADHCKSSAQTVGCVDVECLPDGSCGCEFVAAWNDAIAALRNQQGTQE